MSAAPLVIASGCQRQVDEPVISGPASTEAAIIATTAPASITTPGDVEAPITSTSIAAASTTMPAAPTTTRVESQEAVEAEDSEEAEDVAEPEVDASDRTDESTEPETDKSDEVGDSDANESASVTEQLAELPPLCRELEFDPDDAAGLQWVEPSYFRYQPRVASDENYEAVATVTPRPAYASAAAHDRDGRGRAWPEAYEPQRVVVEITDATGSMTRHQLPLDPPEVLPHYLHYAVIPEAIVIGPQGWLFAASGVMYLRIRELIPGNFDARAPSLDWAQDWNRDGPNYDEEGLYIPLSAVGYTADGKGHEVCFVSFESLGISLTDWRLYGTRSMDGYLWVDEYRGLMWHAEWDGMPIRSDLPESSGECCDLFALSEGYVVVTNNIPLGYGPRAYWPPTLFFSSDGVQWQEVTLPTSDLPFADGEGIWVCHFEEKDTGIRVIEGRFSDAFSPDPCDETRDWAANPDFTNWRLQEPEE